MSEFNNFTRLPYDKNYSRKQFHLIEDIMESKREKVEIYKGLNTAQTSFERVLKSDLTNKREINQLYVRPYLGVYKGVGMSSIKDNDIKLESSLIQGSATKLRNKTSEPVQGISTARFDCLPEFGNPQRVQHIVPPWVLGGQDTRNNTRRIDYYRRCKQLI